MKGEEKMGVSGTDVGRLGVVGVHVGDGPTPTRPTHPTRPARAGPAARHDTAQRGEPAGTRADIRSIARATTNVNERRDVNDGTTEPTRVLRSGRANCAATRTRRTMFVRKMASMGLHATNDPL